MSNHGRERRSLEDTQAFHLDMLHTDLDMTIRRLVMHILDRDDR